MTNIPTPRATAREVLTIAILTLTAVVAVGQTYIALALMDDMADDFGVGVGAATTVTTVFGIAYALGFVAAGPFAARLGVKRVLVASLALASVTALVAGTPSNLPGELGLRAVQGFVTAAFAPCALVYITQQFTSRMRTLTTTYLTTAFLASLRVRVS